VNIDCENKCVDGRSLERIRRRAWDSAKGRCVLGAVNFEGATFPDPVDFSETVFDKALFRGATFEQGANFRRAEFECQARFERTTFRKWVSFRDARFNCRAVFEHPEVEEDEGREVGGWQLEVTFGGWADFRRVHFARGAGFGGATFERRARFGAARFGSVREPTSCSFEGARFVQARTFGPVFVCGELLLGRASFEAPVRIEISARELSCERTHFLSRTTLEVRFADVTLEDAEFGQPSIVAGSLSRFKRDDADDPLDDSELEQLCPSGPTPQISSLHRANVENLAVANVDLERCLFSRAYNLDRLRFGEGVKLDDKRRGLKTRRLIIAEETQFRRPPDKGGDTGKPEGLTADRIAKTYRALRKGREDNKNEPGAADFYYGEMEMRRKDSSGFEKLILTMYWLVSGYGLRASRSVAFLLATVLLFALGLAAFSGFDPDQGFWKSLLFSAESTSGLFRPPRPPSGAELNDEGHIFQMGLRLLGPLFLGLALLALRGRVKR
jgi:uncharacterized protein YjbI with pentapeptide repeats